MSIPSEHAPSVGTFQTVHEPAPSVTGPSLILARRIAFAGAYAVLTILLLRAVANDLEGAQLALEGLADVLPEAIQDLGPDPANLALFAIGLVAFFLAAGSYLVSRETGTAFAVLAVSTAGWFLFPYAEVPWAIVFTGRPSIDLDAGVAVWLLGGLIVALATTEMVASAREAVVRSFTDRHLPAPMISEVRAVTLASQSRLLVASLAVGAGVALLYAQLRGQVFTGVLREPSLLWAPALLGLGVGIAVWLASRVK